MVNVTYEDTCRVCGFPLHNVLNLGKLYPSNFVEQENLDDYTRIPLILAKCSSCGLVQLRHTVDLDTMYRTYFYQSSLNRSMEISLKNVVDEIHKFIELKPGDTVIDIGCNDGTLFKFFSSDITKIGFDPALNLKDIATKHCDMFVNDYFSAESLPTGTKAKVITAIAMLYDLPDPVNFVKDVRSVLDNNGIFVAQFTDLQSMLEINAVDNICFEHLEYYTLFDVINIFHRAGMRVFHVSKNSVNGGSIRIFACKNGAKYSLTNGGKVIFEDEVQYFYNDNIEKFSERVCKIKRQVKNFLRDFAEMDIYGLGASTKGNTLLQYFDITNKDIKKIAEINKDKFGKYTLGSRIPIIPQDRALAEKPDIFFVLPWHFIDTFLVDMHDFMRDGGILFVPLPTPGVYFMRDSDEPLFLELKDLFMETID